MYGLLAMSLVIAVLGVVNTLAMSVFERQREMACCGRPAWTGGV